MLRLSPTERVGPISKTAFLRDYRALGKPAIFEALTVSWPAREKWSVAYLKHVAGDKQVPLYDSRPAQGRQHQHATTACMQLGEYLDRVSAGENDLRIFFLRVPNEIPELMADFAYPDLGLKFVKKLSVLFMGGKGARVQMHFDIDLAEIFLCHFGGKKRVMLFAPDQTPYLYRVPFSFSTLFGVRPDAPDYEKYPALRQARGEIAELGHGDVLYIPSGYWHYVLYDEISFSLSLRALPRRARHLLTILYNVAVLRTVEGMMRKVFGQRWNERNERLAVERTHKRLGLV